METSSGTPMAINELYIAITAGALSLGRRVRR